MTSNPAVQKRTARPSRIGSHVDRSAHGDPGARPARARGRGPSTRCESAVKRFVYGVEEEQRQRDRREQERQPVQARRGRQEERRPRRRGRPARSRPRARPAAARARPCAGFAASIRRSASRLWAIAALRAPTIASRILPSVAGARPAPGREERRREREGKREEGVRELDHLERRSERPDDARRPRAQPARPGAAPGLRRRAGARLPAELLAPGSRDRAARAARTQ